MGTHEHLHQAAEHVAAATAALRSRLNDRISRDLPAGRFATCVRDAQRLAVLEHLHQQLQAVAYPGPVADPPQAVGAVPAEPAGALLDAVA